MDAIGSKSMAMMSDQLRVGLAVMTMAVRCIDQDNLKSPCITIAELTT